MKGILVNDRKVKNSQYADGTIPILDGSKTSLSISLKVLEYFSKISGLRLNPKKKTQAWLCGLEQRQVASRSSAQSFCSQPEIELKWLKDKVKAFGVWLFTYPMLVAKMRTK